MDQGLLSSVLTKQLPVISLHWLLEHSASALLKGTFTPRSTTTSSLVHGIKSNISQVVTTGLVLCCWGLHLHNSCTLRSSSNATSRSNAAVAATGHARPGLRSSLVSQPPSPSRPASRSLARTASPSSPPLLPSPLQNPNPARSTAPFFCCSTPVPSFCQFWGSNRLWDQNCIIRLLVVGQAHTSVLVLSYYPTNGIHRYTMCVHHCLQLALLSPPCSPFPETPPFFCWPCSLPTLTHAV